MDQVDKKISSWAIKQLYYICRKKSAFTVCGCRYYPLLVISNLAS